MVLHKVPDPVYAIEAIGLLDVGGVSAPSGSLNISEVVFVLTPLHPRSTIAVPVAYNDLVGLKSVTG